MSSLLASVPSWLRDHGVEREEGQGVVEYALVLGVLVVALFIAFTTTDIEGAIGRALTALTNVMP